MSTANWIYNFFKKEKLILVTVSVCEDWIKERYCIIKNYDFDPPKRVLLHYSKGHSSSSLQAAFPNTNFILSK